MTKKFRLYQEQFPQVKEQGYRFCYDNEIYLLKWFDEPFCDHKESVGQCSRFDCFANFADAENTIKYLLKKENYRDYELADCVYHDWGIEYTAWDKNWKLTGLYHKFYIRFEPLRDCVNKYPLY